MNTLSIRIDGIYDRRTIEHLNQFEGLEYSFDFRTKETNYLQQYKFLEMIPLIEHRKCYLHFSNEKDFVINDYFLRLEGEEKILENIHLMFSDVQDPQYYDQFETPFAWEYDPDANLKDILKSKYLDEIILSYGLLEDYHKRGLLERFVQNLLSTTLPLKNDIKFTLKANWLYDPMPSLFDIFDFDCILLAISNQVEACYRNVDIAALDSSLINIKQQI